MTKVQVAPKARTYAALIGLAVGMTLAGLALPLIVGDRISDSSGLATTPDQSPSRSAGASVGDDGGARGAAPADGRTPDSGTAGPGADDGTSQQESGPAPAAASGPAPMGGATAGAANAGEVKLGVLLLDLGSIGGMGFQTPGATAEEEREAFDAYIQLVNRSGGINGRPIAPIYRKFDPLQSETMDAACLALAQDAKVFAAIAAPGFSNVHTLCLTERFGIPTHSFQSEAENWGPRSRGLLLTKMMTTHRMLRTVVQQAERQGRLRGKTIGIVTDESHPAISATREALQPSLARLGYDVAHTTVLSEDVDTAARQMPTEILEMRRKNVDLVLWAANVLQFALWINQADSQQFRARYITSDVGGSSEDFGVQQAPASLEAIAYTGNRSSEYRANFAEPPIDADCRRRYEQQTGKKLSRSEEEAGYQTVTRACGWIDVFTTAARKAGSSLTRPAYVTALRSLGPWDYPYNGPGSIQPGKLGIADTVRTKQYDPDCRCWAPIDDFAPAAP